MNIIKSIKNSILQSFYDYINKIYEKRFIKILNLKLKKDNIQASYLVEEIIQKSPLIYQSYLKNNKIEKNPFKMHLRMACFFLSAYSSLRLFYKEKENLIQMLEDISSNIFIKEMKILLKISFIFSKNKLIAIWNYFLILNKSFINLFFSNYISIEKDYKDQKLIIKIKPEIYSTFFEKHKSEFLILSLVSYFDSLFKVIEERYNFLEFNKIKDFQNFSITYTLNYK